MIEHLKQYKQLYVILLSWAIAGAVFPMNVAIGYSVLSFLFLMRSGDQTKVLIAFITMLILSDSRSRMFLWSGDAKIVVAIILWFNILRNIREYSDFDNRIFRYFLPFTIFVFVSTFWSFDLFTSFQRAISFALIYFSIPLLYLKALKENPRINATIIWYVVFVLGIGLFIHLISPGFTTITGRFRGLLGNPNGMGLFLLLVFLLAYLTYQRHKDDYNLGRLTIIFLVVFGLSLVLTGSRSAIFSIIIFLIFSRLQVLTNLVSVLAFLALVASYEYLLFRLPDIIMYLGLEDYFRLQTLQEGSGRTVAWNFAWMKIEDVFYFGGGMGYTDWVYKQHGAELSRLGHQGNAHSSYLTIWLDSGLFGLALFIFGLLATVINAVANSRYTLPMVFAILFTTYFESWLAGTLSPFTSLFLILLTALQQESEIVDEALVNGENDEDTKIDELDRAPIIPSARGFS